MNTKKDIVLDNYKEYYEDMILRDYLALDRTLLANERTFLAYIRTVVSFVVAGLTLWKLVEGINGTIAAMILFISSIFIAIHGTKNYIKVSNKLKKQ